LLQSQVLGTNLCLVDGCKRRTQAKGLCSTHYQRHRKGVPLDAPMRKSRTPEPCVIDGCVNQGWARGMCPMHYFRWRTRGDAGIPEKERPGGSRVVTRNGYVLIHTPGHHASYKDGYVLEHRLVMEAVLGRALDPSESVHHRNGDRADNRPENLELWVVPQPSGQRPEDLVAWVVEHYPDLTRDSLARLLQNQ